MLLVGATIAEHSSLFLSLMRTQAVSGCRRSASRPESAPLSPRQLHALLYHQSLAVSFLRAPHSHPNPGGAGIATFYSDRRVPVFTGFFPRLPARTFVALTGRCGGLRTGEPSQLCPTAIMPRARYCGRKA